MTKKVILHIGHDKTATTSIQDTFTYNTRTLDNYGYYYPLWDGYRNHNRLFIILFKQDVYKYERLFLIHEIDLSRIEKIRSDVKEWLTKRLLNCSASNIVFSGEYFPNFNEAELAAIKEFFNQILGEVEFVICAYTRDPVSYASSAYQQQVRRQSSDNKAIYFPYEEKIGRYIKAFGRKSINLYKFEDACQYHNGPVYFLLSKIGLKDKAVDQMRIHRRNDSMSDMAVDLFKYINRELPLDGFNIRNGLRSKRDYKYLKSLPGGKFQLLEEDTDILRDKTISDMIWLKEIFDISYSLDCKSPGNIHIEFNDYYVKKMIVVLRKSNPIMRKLIHGYIKLKMSEANLDARSQNNLLILESHFKNRYTLAINLSYTKLAYRQKVVWVFYDLLRRSKTLRWLKHQWIDKQGSIS